MVAGERALHREPSARRRVPTTSSGWVTICSSVAVGAVTSAISTCPEGIPSTMPVRSASINAESSWAGTIGLDITSLMRALRARQGSRWTGSTMPPTISLGLPRSRARIRIEDVMTLHPENYLYIYSDPRGYRDLKRELRLLPEEQREAFIMEMVRRRPAVGLRLANACMRNRAFFLRLLREGVCTADISRISMWLRCITPRLGAGRVL